MPEKVLILHRFPKSQMVRIGQSFELMDAAGKKANEAFPAEQLGAVRAVLAAGGYGDLPLMEDYALFARMLMGGARAVNVPEPLVFYRVGEAAFKRRGGRELLRSELRLQREFRRMAFTSRPRSTSAMPTRSPTSDWRRIRSAKLSPTSRDT